MASTRIIDFGPPLIHEDVADAETADVATYSREVKGGICVADGYGLRVSVERGHLDIADGIGSTRRTRRFAKATHGLSRVVLLGGSGMITLEALRWCDRLQVPMVVLDPEGERPIFASIPKGRDDARLRRQQALAPQTTVGLGLARELLGAKLEGQAQVLRDRLERTEPADTIDSLRQAMHCASSIEEARGLEAAAAGLYWQAWVAHPACEVRFAAKDLPRVPEHWRRYDGRRSVLMSVSGNRRAERPVNALLNYLFALAEVEASLACTRVGLDPGLGLVHLDAQSRASLALDLMEPVRPAIESYVLDLVQRRTFLRRDFAEATDGHVRLLPPLTHELAETLPRWRGELAPWAERVANAIGQAMDGKFQAATPLTGRNLKAAQDRVRLRKQVNRSVLEKALGASRPKQRPEEEPQAPPAASCRHCGAVIPGRSRRYCPTCGVAIPGQDVSSRARRAEAISATRKALEDWKHGHPDAEGDSARFRAEILPGLASVKLSAIMAAIGCAKSTASMIRAGRHVPALRHWAPLAALCAV